MKKEPKKLAFDVYALLQKRKDEIDEGIAARMGKAISSHATQFDENTGREIDYVEFDDGTEIAYSSREQEIVEAYERYIDSRDKSELEGLGEVID